MLEELMFGAEAADALLADCLSHRVKERVGLLLGNGSFVTSVIPLKNHTPHSYSQGFRIRGSDIEEARARGRNIIGRYHTHLNVGAFPSDADRRSLPAGWFEVIASLRGPRGRRALADLRAYASNGRLIALNLNKLQTPA